MKNIIKRGTSLLLVLAMLLSFAAVVGAADERLPAEGEKPVTLSLDSVVLRQGSTDVQYVPVRLTIEPGFAITGFQLAAVSSDESAVEVTGFYPKRPLKIYEDGSVNYDETIGTIFGKLYSNYGSSESKDPVQKFACANEKGVTSETISTRAEDGVIKEPDLAGYIGVKVKDGAQSGAYQLSIIPNASRDRDTTKRNDIVFTIGTQNTYTDAYATLNAGTAIVLPEGVNLPTVILTDDTFAVPTWAQMKAGEDIYPLAGRMKIVGTDGKLYAVDPTTLTVEKDSVPTGVSVKNNQLEILTSTLRNDDTLTGTGTLRVTNAKAVGADISVTSATVSFKVNRAPAVATHVGFGYSGYNPVPADATPREAESKTAENVQFNLGYGSLGVFDQYSDSIPGLTPTVDLKLYSDAFQTELQPEDEVITAKQVTMGTSTLTISKDLKKDVWCEIKTSWTNSDGSKTITGDTVKVHITSNYPQPKKAIISLTDGTNPVSNTIEIPAIGAPDKMITYAVTSFLDQNGTPMDKDTTPESYTVTFKVPTTTTVPGVECTNGTSGTITVKSTAASKAPITVTFEVMVNGQTIPAYLTAEAAEAETPTATLTIKKADPIASSLASKKNDEDTFHDGEIYEKGSETGNVTLTELPGIGEEKTVELVPLYVLDQYDQPITNEYAQAANFQLYKVDGTTETKIDSDCVNFEKVGDTHVKLLLTNKLGTDGKLVLTKGTYKIKAEWSLTEDSPVLTASSAAFELKEAASVYTGTALYSNNAIADVPYIYGTPEGKTSSVTVTATFKNQYGVMPVSGIPMYTLDEESIKLNGKAIENKAVTYNKTGEQITFRVNSSAAQCFTNDEPIKLEATMSAKFDDVTVQNIPISITLRKDASKLAHLKVTGTASDGTTGFTKEATILDKDETASYNLIVPNTGSRTYTIALSDVEDQYGTALTDKVSRAVVTSGLTAADALKYDKATKTLTVRSDAAGGKAVLTFTESGTTTGHKVELTLNFAQMSFVNSDGADYKVGMWLNTNPKDYAGQTWAELYNQIKWGAAAYPTVHIENEDGTAGQDVTSSVKVVVKKDGAEVFNSSKTYTEQPKANAGTYTIELIYVKDEGEGKTNSYPIDSFTNFTISPKTVKITVNGAITKEYDGTQSLVLPSSVTLTIEGNPADLTVDPSALQYESADASTAAINIVLAANQTTCLTGDAAINYNVSLDGLTGTITPRKLIVTPKAKTFEYGENDKITTALTTEFDYAGKNGDLPSGLTPTITGSMKLTDTTNGADVTVYDAGTYKVVNNNLSAGTNYEIEFPATSVQWTINRKLLTKVKNSGLPQSAFGVNTDQGCISHLLRMFAKDADGSLIEGLRVSDFVDESKLSFPSNTVVTGPSGKQYPVPKTYTLTVTNKPTKDIGKNYRVDDTTEYEFDYTVNRPDASLLTVTLTGDTYTYNGMEQGPTVSVTYKNQANDTLDLTSCCTIGGTTKATDAGTYTITVTSDLLSVSKTATWKINPKTITKDMFSQKTPHPVYDGTEQTLTGGVLDGKDSGIQVNGENKVLQLGTDFTAGEVKETNAGEYTMTVTGQGNYTGTADVKVKIDKFVATGENLLLSMSISSNQVTRGKTTTLYIDTAVLLKSDELEQFNGQKEGKVTWVVGKNTPNATINVEALENQKKLKVTVTVPNDATPDKEHAQIAITLQTAFNVDGGTHQNIESGQVRTYQLYVTDKEQQENFKIDQGESGTYSYSQGSLQLTASGSATGSTVTWSSSDTSVATVDNGKVTFVKPGDATITATASETDDYAATSDTYTLTITKGQVTVSASSATMTANDPLPGFSATASGLNPNDSVSEVFQTLTASAATDGKTAGTFRVTPNATFKTGGRKNWSECYDLYFVAGTLTVNPAVSVIDTVLPTIIAGNGCANGYANCACESFYDLDASRWYHEAIDWAYSLGLMNGTTKSTFGPNAAATRAQTWTMLARIAGQDTRRSSTWYEVGQKWAVNLGITDGTNPMGSLTREQLAAMLYRYVGSPAVNGTLTFTDSANVSAWARNAMIWAVQNGILDGVGGNRLNPKGTTTRAQAAAIFMRFSKLINK